MEVSTFLSPWGTEDRFGGVRINHTLLPTISPSRKPRHCLCLSNKMMVSTTSSNATRKSVANEVTAAASSNDAMMKDLKKNDLETSSPSMLVSNPASLWIHPSSPQPRRTKKQMFRPYHKQGQQQSSLSSLSSLMEGGNLVV